MQLTPTETKFYVGVWASACVGATVLAARKRGELGLFRRAYWRALGTPIRLVPFGFAFAFFCFAAPYVGDPTWDRFDGGMMAALAYATAPFSVGTLYRVARGLAPGSHAVVAGVLALFSSSFCYDGYLLFRDGRYPPSFLWNLVASLTVYTCAGLFFSLFSPDGKSVALLFRERAWFDHPDARRVGAGAVAVGLVFATVVIVSMAPFLTEIWQVIRRR